MISSILRNCRKLQRPIYLQLFNQTDTYRVLHTSQYRETNHQVSPGNVLVWQWWHKFWKSWAPVPTLFGLTIFIVWQYSRKLQNRYVNDTCSTASRLEIQCYRTIPTRFLSRSWGRLSQVQIPTPFRKFFYLTFSKTYGINLDEIKDDLNSYPSLGEFFIRHLKDDVRPISNVDMVSPADGTVLNCGRVTSCCVEQVKGTTYLIKSFLGDNTWSSGGKNNVNSNSSTSSGQTGNLFASQMSYMKINENLAGAFDKRSEFLLNQNILSQFENELYYSNGDVFTRFSPEESQSCSLDKQNYGKTKCKNYEIEIPVVPKLLDYYVKDIVCSIYSSISLSSFKSTLPFVNYYSTSTESFEPMSPSMKGSKPNLCTPSAEDEWRTYKQHLLQNPAENDLYQMIVYLAPGDYHRFHSPAETSIQYRRHFQGDLLSVNPCVACWIPDLFVLNERAAYMGTWKHGFFSMVMVGATNVGSIKVHCDETLLTNCKRWSKGVRHKDLELSTNWKKGDEVGEFRMGSTIVLLFEAPKSFQFNVASGEKVKVGQSIVQV